MSFTFLQYGSTPVAVESQVQKALLVSVCNTLRNTIGDNSPLRYLQSRSIKPTIDERAEPTSADRFIGIYLTSLGRESNGPNRREEYQVNISFTARKVGIPSDSRGTSLVTDVNNPTRISMSEVVEAIVSSIDGQIRIINEANQLFTNPDKFQTIPLFIVPNVELLAKEVGPEHFYTQPTNRGVPRTVENFEAYNIQIPFQSAVRYVNTIR